MPRRKREPQKEGKPLSAKEVARRARLKQVGSRGGFATFRKYGRPHMVEIGRAGWRALVARRYCGDASEAVGELLDKAEAAILAKCIRRVENRRDHEIAPVDFGRNVSVLTELYEAHGLDVPEWVTMDQIPS